MAKKKPQKKQKTYYMQLKQDFKILDFMETFKTDFLEHDKKILRGYKGDFILQVRKTGSTLLKLRKNKHFDKLEKMSWDEAEKKGLYEEKKDLIERKRNWKEIFEVWILQTPVKRAKGELRFFYGTKGKVREIKTKKELREIWQRYNDGKLYA